MRVFVTGATGFIGEAVVQELIAAGHGVLGLARNEASAQALTKAGAQVQRGDLKDHASLIDGVRASDGVIHLAFIHDFHAYDSALATDREALEAMLGALAGTNKPFVGTSGSLMLPRGRLGTEQDPAPLDGHPRGRAETIVVDAAKRGVRSSVVRLAPTVHDAGDKGFIPMIIATARRTGVAAYVDDGANRWPAVHRADAARLFRLALERASAGSRLHGIGEEGVPMRTIAETIGAALKLPLRSISADEARAHFDWMAMFIGADNPTSNAITRQTLDWTPRGIGLLDDMRAHYFG